VVAAHKNSTKQKLFFCFLFFLKALLVFYVPSESGEKVTLGISALLSMTVFLMTIRESLPPTEKTPLISKKRFSQVFLFVVIEKSLSNVFF